MVRVLYDQRTSNIDSPGEKRGWRCSENFALVRRKRAAFLSFYGPISHTLFEPVGKSEIGKTGRESSRLPGELSPTHLIGSLSSAVPLTVANCCRNFLFGCWKGLMVIWKAWLQCALSFMNVERIAIFFNCVGK